MGTPIRVERLDPRRRDDYLRFFDHEQGAAFADNPDWAKCYCHFFHVPASLDWGAFDAGANRTAIAARIEVGEMDGFLAYAGDEVVGWLNAQPLNKLPHCWGRLGIAAPPVDVAPADLAAIVCFVIAPSWRRRGVARALLAGAVRSLAARGIRRVYAFPREVPDGAAASAHYQGPEALFREAGFTALHRAGELTLMAREMAGSDAQPRCEP